MPATYPLSSFHFQVEWGGTRVDFTEVSGLTIENEVIEYRQGADPEYGLRKMPGLRQHGTITLKRGILSGDNEAFAWINSILLNTVERRDITIKVLDEAHEPVVVYSVRNAWPAKLKSTKLDSMKSAFAIESMEIVHEGLEITNG